ncbi:MAG TPA: alpha/beta hydrolase [Polyangiaceae bacterium]|nr:alpha/beta hydrolase [Polyangiaceae bacterium]
MREHAPERAAQLSAVRSKQAGSGVEWHGDEAHVPAADGTPIYARRAVGGAPTTALFFDGIACDGFVWKYLWDDLRERLSVAHFHYRGHGRSGAPRNEDRIDVAAHAADADAVRHALGDPPVVLVGHSFGTQVALEAYRLRPEGVRALVLVCGSFGRVTYTFKGTDMLAGVLPDMLSFVTRHPHLGRALWAHVPPKVALALAKLTGDVDVSRVNPEDVEPYFDHVVHLDFALFLRMLRAAGEHSAEDLLPRVAVPVLVVAGELDSFTPPQVSRAMAEAIPGAELALCEGGSHLLPLERHDEIKRLVTEFLSRRVPDV